MIEMIFSSKGWFTLSIMHHFKMVVSSVTNCGIYISDSGICNNIPL